MFIFLIIAKICSSKEIESRRDDEFVVLSVLGKEKKSLGPFTPENMAGERRVSPADKGAAA